MAILLMTATITPPVGAVRLARIDPTDRLGDYCAALSFYLGVLGKGAFRKIVFAENSASDLARLRGVAGEGSGDSVEFLSFFGLNYPERNGRAYGEMRLIEHAMRHSQAIADAPEEEMIWKVTGRYMIPNITSLIAVDQDVRMCCHCRNYPVRWTDMYLMGWRNGVYKSTLATAAEHLKEDDSNESAEVKLRRLVDGWAKHLKVSRRFAVPPQVIGTRGFDNARYEEQRLKERFRSVVARYAPWVWI